MSRAGFMRRQAETCIRLAQKCSNHRTAQELRLMGAEFFKKAIEAENEWLRGHPPDDATDRHC